MTIDSSRLWRITVLAFLGFLVGLAALTYRPMTAQAEVVKVPNENLRNLIKNELYYNQGKTDIYARDITVADMLLVKQLECEGADLSDLTGLENAVNLEELDLHTCKVKDLKPLTNLTSLKVLKLYNNSFKDITPLKELTNLQILWLGENEINDFSPLQNLINLEYLHLPQRMKDISSLKNLTKLKELSICNSVFEDLPTHILDISPLAAMTELQNLYLSYNNINDISPLKNSVKLKHLEMQGNNCNAGWSTDSLFYNVGFSDISALRNMTELEYLDFSCNRVENISVLAGMTSLKKVSFQFNNVRNISALNDLPYLREADCSDNYLEILWNGTEPLSAAAQVIYNLEARKVILDYSNQDPSHVDPSYPQIVAAAGNPAGVEAAVAPNDKKDIDVLHIKLTHPSTAFVSCQINSMVFDFTGQEKNGKSIDAAVVNTVTLFREYDYPSGTTEQLGQLTGGSQMTFSGLNQLLEPGQTRYYILRYTLDKSDPNNATYGATISPGQIGATSVGTGQNLIVRGGIAQGTFFRKGGALKIDVMPSGSGTVEVTPNWTSYGVGDQITLKATPAQGYVLDYFHNQQNTSGNDWKIRSNPAVITVNWQEDVEGKITAIFDKGPTSSDGKNHGKLKDPVNTATGEFYFETPLFDLGGPLPLKSSLYYGSALSSDPDVNSSFGHVIGSNWLHNYQMMRLYKSDQETAIVYDRGKTLNFTNSGTGWELSESGDIPYSLKSDSSGNFYLLDPEKELVYKFNADLRLSQVEDRNGNRHTLTYDGNGNLAAVADGLGRTLNFSYQGTRLSGISDGYGRAYSFGYTGEILTSLTDPMGNVTEFTGSNAEPGLITAVTYPKGNRPYIQTYDGEERVIKQTDTYGDVTGLDFSGQSEGKTTITYPDQSAVKHNHLGKELLSELEDPSGHKVEMEYDDNKRNTLVRDRVGGETGFSYQSESGKIASITNPQDETLSYTYTSQEQSFGLVTFIFDNLIRIDYPDGYIEKYTYDANGNITKWIDRNGHIWQYAFNQHGQVTGITNPLGGQEAREFNLDGTLAATSDTDTSETTYTYDDYRRLKSIQEPGNLITHMEYDLNDCPVAVTVPGGQTATFEYDANGNLIKETCGDRMIAYNYDDMDRLVKSTDETGKTNSIEYDAMGRPQSITDALGNNQQFQYDSNGWLTGIVDRTGQEWQFGYDAEGVLEKEALPAGQEYIYQKDLRGYITSITDPLGKKISIARDYLGRVTALIDQLGLKTRYIYDGQGNLTGVTMPGGSSSAYGYNQLGLLSSIKDPNQNNWLFGYTPMGRPASLSDPLGSQTLLGYDDRGRLVQIDYPDGESAQLSYNAAGNISRKTYSSGLELYYSYDTMDRPVAVNGLKLTYNQDDQVTVTEDSGTGITFGAGYDREERITRADYNNEEFYVNYTYDRRDQLTRVEDSLTSNWVEFTYDDNGNLIRTSRSNGINTTLIWDDAGRLTGLKDGDLASQEYTLNQAGEVVQADCQMPIDPATLLATSENRFNYDSACQPSNSGYVYDARGRRTDSPAGKYSWDAEERLISAGNAQMAYNGWGDILTRSEGSQNTRYFYNYGLGLTPIAAEKNEVNGRFTYYVWTPEGRLLYGIDGADKKVFFYHFDRQGSTQFLTNKEGEITDSYAYTPYGQLLGTQGVNSQPFTYGGAMGVRQESNNGLYQMRERYYDAVTGSFLSRDPLWPDLYNPGSLNPYAYVNGNPVSYIDPTGEEGKKGETVYGSSGVKANSGTSSALDTSKSVGSAVSAGNTTLRVGSKAVVLGGKLSKAAAASKIIGSASSVSNVASKVAVPLTVVGGLIDAGRATKMTYIMIRKPSGQAYGKLKGELGAQYVRFFCGDKKDQADVIREMQSGFVSGLIMKATGAVYDFFAGK